MRTMRLLWAPVVLIGLLLVGAPAAKAGTQDFTIQSFDVDYYLTRDSAKVPELRANERISAQFPDFDQNHGILRAIPESYQGHGLELTVTSVQDFNGNALPYSTSHDNGNLVTKIGDANRYVHGTQNYAINYTMRGVIMDTKDAQEFYWDVNGDQWSQSFGQVEARLHVPADIASSLQAPSRCYTGGFGSQNTSDCSVLSDGGGQEQVITVATHIGKPLEPKQTLTMELGFKAGTFAPYSMSARELGNILAKVAAVVALPVLTSLILLRNYLRHGRDPKGKGVIVPQYLPPKDVSVLAASTVFNEGYQTKAVSATVVDLAVRHYFKIYEVEDKGLFKKKDYEIELVRSPADLKTEEKAVADMLFGSGAVVGARVSLESLKTKLSEKSEKLGKDIEQQVTTVGYFGKAPNKVRLPYFLVAIVFMIAGFFVFGAGDFGLFTGIAMIVSAGIIAASAFAMPARTAMGVELREYLLGLRDYIKLAEADRLKALQTPSGGLTEKIDTGNNRELIKLYERLLPYAMLFGLEQEWAKTMAPLYEQAPDWYSGNAAFNAAWFAGSLGSFSSAAGTAFAPPSSSGSGGGAGGGGGGGGGGGW